MASAAQIAANRANSQKSTGPTSGPGKERSRANSTLHGLTGTVALRTPGEQAAFDDYYNRLLPELRPSGELQLETARRIVYSMFRLAQVPVIEANIFALGHANYPVPVTQNEREAAAHDALSLGATFLRDGKSFAHLSLYEQRLSRSLQKDLALLRQLQKEAAAEQSKPRAAVRPQLQEPTQPIDPITKNHEIGFVCPASSAHPAPPPPATQNAPDSMAA